MHLSLARALATVLIAASVGYFAQADTWTESTTLDLPQPNLMPQPDGTTHISIPGWANRQDPGNPTLPLKVFEFAVHPGIDLTTVTAELLDARFEQLAQRHVITPAPPARTQQLADGRRHAHVEWGLNKEIFDSKWNANVYAVDAPFPATRVEVLPYGQQRTWKFVRVLVNPIQYNPVSGQLHVLRAATLQINYDYEPHVVPPADPVGMRWARDRFTNFAQLQSFYRENPAHPGPRTTYNYIIITTADVANNSTGLANYVAHRTAQGYSILVKPIEDIEAEYTQALRPELFETTDERADRIRAFLKDKYLDYSTEFLMIIGHPDPDDPTDDYDWFGTVPMKFCFPDWDVNPYHAPTDSYYAELTGQWDLDGDTIYGEWNGDRGPGGVDFSAAELHVGRIPYYHIDIPQVDAVMQKIMDYEEVGADESWKRRGFMPNPIDWSDNYGREGNTSPVPMAEWIKDNVLVPEGFDYYRIYEHNYTYPPHNVSPPPEQIPEDLGYTCFTRFDSSHFFVAGFNVSSNDPADYPISALTDGSNATSWSQSMPAWSWVQLRSQDPGDNWPYAPYKVVLRAENPSDFPSQFEIRMASSASFGDSFTIVTEDDAANNAVPAGGYWELVYTAPDEVSTVGGKHYIRLVATTYAANVQLNEFSVYTEEAGSIQPYVIPEWLNGYGVVYYNTHGWGQGAAEIITSPECYQLDDDHPSFVFSKACSTAYPEADDNLCATFVWAGGIGSCGATRVSYGWGDPGYQLFMPRLITQNQPFGVVINGVREDMEANNWYGWAGLYFDAMKFNIYGDPTVRLLTDQDEDTLPYWEEEALGTDPNDADSDDDGFNDAEDNCPLVYNPDQTDVNGNGIGDACEDFVELEHVTAVDTTTVEITYSQPVEQASAEDLGNYSINGGIDVLTATLAADDITVTLTTSELAYNVTYTLSVSGVRDRDNPDIEVPPGTTAEIYLSSWIRVYDGLSAFYTFDEADGTTIYDVSEFGEPLDLTIDDPAGATWTDGGLLLAGTHAYSATQALKIGDACVASDEVTVEAWIVPSAAEQAGPACIATYSNSIWARNFTLGQGASDGSSSDQFDFRLRTTDTDINGLPSLTTPTGAATTDLTHVAYTRAADGTVRFYVDGTDVLGGSGFVSGMFDTWNTGYKLVVGSELTGDDSWLGEIRLLAVYGRALSEAEVLQNYGAGPDEGGAAPAEPGDLNCDGAVDFDDIAPFVLALGGQAGYEAQWPDCNWINADCNGDTVVDFDDISAFVALLSQ